MTNIKKRRFHLICTFTIIIAILWSTGLLHIWTGGMHIIAGDREKFTNTQSHLIEGSYSVSIDLSNLERNVGKELYNDGQHKITVFWVDNTGTAGNGGFRIGFRSSGPYSLTGASLISGVHHIRNENSYSYDMSAQMTATYNNKIYDSSTFSVSALNYRDGDEFGFYIFPSDAYDSGEISLDETGVVELTVTNLYQNIWSRK